jgi:hypothetical protein
MSTVDFLTAASARILIRESTPIQKEQNLPSFAEHPGHSWQEFPGKQSILFLQVDNADGGRCASGRSAGQFESLKASAIHQTPCFNRGCGTPHNESGGCFTAAAHSDLAGMIPGGRSRFVGSFMFFVNNYQTQILQRGEYCASGAQYKSGLAGLYTTPFGQAPGWGEPGVYYRYHRGKSAFQTFNKMVA